MNQTGGGGSSDSIVTVTVDSRRPGQVNTSDIGARGPLTRRRLVACRYPAAATRSRAASRPVTTARPEPGPATRTGAVAAAALRLGDY